ncbi:hypothetical protein H6F76_17135 [Leptolyngbya sp. FACHB-321]|uniref:hypothetical protein n=1 Tax=Leptolyngbya sp. FACHB-321 TaxID=2692807 RepID=UPI001689FBFA|nr:hypothetical protein [Leptolyngbya sp. FACHB-321]MBD2036735.1 hypothetical protein [Leptolyngbya sp. FACHB-321]
MLLSSSRSLTKTFPWAALILLFSAYSTVGMFLAEFPFIWVNWTLAIAGVFLVTMVFTFPQFQSKQWFSHWLRSDTSAFILLVVAAALLSVMLLWIHIFLKLVTILAAETLTRLELSSSGFSVVKSFWLLMITALLGLTLGWSVSSII